MLKALALPTFNYMFDFLVRSQADVLRLLNGESFIPARF